jgi:uncharacterized RDD family membrane protein YckC
MTASDDPPARASAAPGVVAEGDGRFIGVATRTVSWLLDAVLINLAAVMVGLGTALVLSLSPVAKSAQPLLQAIAGAAYVIWCAVYFVAFWSTTGQTPGARVMQIRLVTAAGERLKPARALVRWVGMNLAMVPLFAGYIPILYRRRGFPDWLAKTLVLDTPQDSFVEVRRAAIRAKRDGLDERDRDVTGGPVAVDRRDGAPDPRESSVGYSPR